ncbi:hypothetical protein ACFXKK_34075 [Streptomyces globisporus]|uniref:ATP-dependent DNA ligase n=1 Tax=Streptomyces globisporus TaxID=1908 RepID=UPI00364714A7
MALLPGTVLDGEAVIWQAGTVDFGAVQARAASTLDRARALAARLPASFAAFEVLAHADHGGDALPARPYTERRTVLVDVPADVGPPLQPVLATADRDTALQWYETLQPQGVEGIVAKPGGSPSPFGGRTLWRKVRHADTTDARVVGTVGPRRRPRRLAPSRTQRAGRACPPRWTRPCPPGSVRSWPTPPPRASTAPRPARPTPDSTPAWWSRYWPGRAATAR